MPTTPNYGWDTPADTDYVTNGALAIRTMANDADATVYAVEQDLDAVNAAKVAKAGDSMSGPLVVPTSTGAGRAVGIAADAALNGIIQFLDAAAAVQKGYLSIYSDVFGSFAITSNGNSLNINNLGETTRIHNGETRPMPFATECGFATVGANTNVTVSLDTGRFTQAPIILVTPNSVTTSAITYHAGTSTTSSFKIFNTSSASRDFFWQAIQMTSTSAAG